VVGKNVATTSNNAQSGQVSGKYYRTRSLSQNLQQIFHPNRQSHSRSINNLSAVGATARPQTDPSINNNNNNFIINNNNNQKMIDEKLNVPQSLPQSPRIQIETPDQFIIPNSYDSYKMNHSKSLNFSPSLSQQHQYGSPPSIYSNSSISSNNRFSAMKSNEFTSSAKLKGYNLGGYRRSQYTRSLSMEVPKQIKPLQKRPSWEERRGSNSSNNQDSSYSDNQYQINEVVKENVELLRKYSDPKVHGYMAHPQEPSSISLLQSTFKAKLASLFKNKKKYTIMEPASGKENSGNEMYSMNRYNSAQSLPALVSSTAQQKKNCKPQKKKHKTKKISVEKYGCDGKLKKLNLNPPQMIGGSFDNLLLINRMNKKKDGLGPYGTYHGRPLLSQAARLKALYKYRKPSESDDATTLSFDYDSGDMSDASSLVRSSDDIDEEMSSSYSDFTYKSGSQAYQIRSSASVNSMPPLKFKRHETKKYLTPMRSPVSSSELQGTPQLPMLNLDAFNNNNNNMTSSNTFSSNFSSGSRMFNMPATYTKFNTVPHQHQHVSQALYSNPFNRNDYSMTMPMMHHQYNSYNAPPTSAPIKPSFLASFASSSSYDAQMIKNFFTSGPGSSPLVSFLSLQLS